MTWYKDLQGETIYAHETDPWTVISFFHNGKHIAFWYQQRNCWWDISVNGGLLPEATCELVTSIKEVLDIYAVYLNADNLNLLTISEWNYITQFIDITELT